MNVFTHHENELELRAYVEAQFIITGLTTEGYMLEKKEALYRRYRFIDIENADAQQRLLQAGWVGTAVVSYEGRSVIQFRC